MGAYIGNAIQISGNASLKKRTQSKS